MSKTAVIRMDSNNGSPLVMDYDWTNEENASKWRGLFVGPLQKVLIQVHPQFTAKEDALEYVENLLLRLLAMLTAKPAPMSVADVEKRVSATFPKPIDDWALAEAQRALEKGKKKSTLVLPFDKVHSLLKDVLHNNKLDDQVSLYLVAVLDYIAADILKLAGNYVKNIRHQVITCQDIKVAMCADKVLMDMFYQDEGMVYTSSLDDDSNSYMKQEQSYDEIVKELIIAEKQYLRDLFMITKVFRDLLHTHNIATPRELEAIFSNINDVTEVTLTLIGSLEDTLEMTEEGNVPAIGTCFEELAEAEEFEVYEKFARDILDANCRRTLEELLNQTEVASTLKSSGHGMKEAFKFYLPKLLLGPVFHCFHYFKYTELLMKLTQAKEDADSLKQVVAMITPLKTKLENMVQNADPSTKRKSDIFHRSSLNKVSRQQALQKLSLLQQSISNWEGRDIASNSSEIVYEGKLQVLNKNLKTYAERYVFLLDGMILICKQQKQMDYRLREKFLIRRVDVIDSKEDSNQIDLRFVVINRDQSKVTFKAECSDDKRSWMAALVMLNTKSMLERTLDLYLGNDEKKYPLRFPPSDRYQFAEPNSSQNIVFEDREKTSGVPLIKGATLVKLVERLTYHVYADPMFMKTFLTTYRSFCTPNELLDLLIARFNIPDPEFSSDSESDSEIGDKTSKMRIAQDMKRFRKEYSQPVQFRVLNVLKHWVDQHFYDFEQDLDLLHKLTSFLDKIAGKSMKKWVECISKIVQRRLSNEETLKGVIFDKPPPDSEAHICNAEESWPGLLTFHPIEIARQLTLLEFQYYRAVKPSELVDLAWTREDKDKRSPNLLKMTRHITNLTRYMEKLIVESENLEERVCVVHRILEIMVVLQEYNNFNGVLALTSVLNSAAVHRIVAKIKDKFPNSLLKSLDEASLLVQGHFKVYWEKLRSINPPCVPFFGQYQTNILFLEEGNPDFLTINTNLINFTKRRKVAEIISEIQQYQNQPYCLHENAEIRAFLESLDPFSGMDYKEIMDYLWQKSLELEPRGEATASKKRPEAERRWKGLDLRTPGIKTRNQRGKSHPNPLPKMIIMDRENDSPMTSPNFKSSPVSGPNTPIVPSATPTSFTSFPTNSPPEHEDIKVTLVLPHNPSHHYNSGGGGGIGVTAPPPLPPKPRRNEIIIMRQQQSPPPPPLPPRQPPLPPRATPTRGALESRSPHMDPVEPRREHHFFMQQHHNNTVHGQCGTPPALVPRRHSNLSNGSQQGQRYPPPPLSLRAGSEGASPSYSPLWPDNNTPGGAPPYRAPSLSAGGSGRGHTHIDLNNSLGTMSVTPSSSTSVGSGGNHFIFSEATPPPRPPPHRPVNTMSNFDDAL